MGNGLGILAAKEADFMIHSLVKFHLFGQEPVPHDNSCQYFHYRCRTYYFCFHCKNEIKRHRRETERFSECSGIYC